MGVESAEQQLAEIRNRQQQVTKAHAQAEATRDNLQAQRLKVLEKLRGLGIENPEDVPTRLSDLESEILSQLDQIQKMLA